MTLSASTKNHAAHRRRARRSSGNRGGRVGPRHNNHDLLVCW